MPEILEFLDAFGPHGIKLITNMAWAAGLFEGEGSFTIHKSRNPTRKDGWTNIRIYPAASLSMTDKDVMERFAKIVGMGNVTGPYKTKGREGKKDKFMWMVINKKALLLADMFRPFLMERRKNQIEGMLSRCGRFVSNDPKEYRGPNRDKTKPRSF